MYYALIDTLYKWWYGEGGVKLLLEARGLLDKLIQEEFKKEVVADSTAVDTETPKA